MKFEQYEYIRPDLKSIKNNYLFLLKKLSEAKDYDSFQKALMKIQEIRNNFQKMQSLVNIKYMMNTRDKFYVSEREIMDKIIPEIQNIDRDFFETIISSKFKEDFNKEYGKNIIEKMILSLKTISPKVMGLLEKENELTSEYFKLIGSAELVFHNKKMNLSQIRFYFDSKDRSIRKEANETYWKFFLDNEKNFDDLYDKLVKIRHKIAIELGYESFIDLAYDRWGRNNFDKYDVKKLREDLFKIFIPLTKKIRQWQKENLKVSELRYYDEHVFIDKEVTPKGDTSSKISNTQEMFLEMGNETKEFFSYMVNNNLLDLTTREGKASGAFCEFIKCEKSPFIFMNLNNTSKDITTLIHECGHALADYKNKDKQFLEWNFMGLETAEIHSMSMEFFSWPWQKSFFDDEDKFKLIHLIESILFIPYGLLIDEFQHWVYENPEANPQERKLKWREFEKKYLADIKYTGNDFLEKGGFWFRQLHLFELPFYYIDYVIAQLCAFQYLLKSRKDYSRAWKDYLSFIDSSIDSSFHESLEIGKLKNPFKENTIREVTSEIEKLFRDLIESNP